MSARTASDLPSGARDDYVGSRLREVERAVVSIRATLRNRCLARGEAATIGLSPSFRRQIRSNADLMHLWPRHDLDVLLESDLRHQFGILRRPIVELFLLSQREREFERVPLPQRTLVLAVLGAAEVVDGRLRLDVLELESDPLYRLLSLTNGLDDLCQALRRLGLERATGGAASADAIRQIEWDQLTALERSIYLLLRRNGVGQWARMKDIRNQKAPDGSPIPDDGDAGKAIDRLERPEQMGPIVTVKRSCDGKKRLGVLLLREVSGAPTP